MNALTSNTPAIIPSGTTSGPLASPATATTTPETTETQPLTLYADSDNEITCCLEVFLLLL